MKDLVFITGNQHKADLLAKWLKLPVEHQKVDLDEIQSLNPYEVVDHKVKQAYEIVGKPVLVEDVSVVFTALGRLPGTLIKWFLEELGTDGLSKLAAGLSDQKAECRIVYALYDGHEITHFESSQRGIIAPRPRGTGGFGWNAIFQPDGSAKTYAEMGEAEIETWSLRAHAIEKLRRYLTKS